MKVKDLAYMDDTHTPSSHLAVPSLSPSYTPAATPESELEPHSPPQSLLHPKSALKTPGENGDGNTYSLNDPSAKSADSHVLTHGSADDHEFPAHTHVADSSYPFPHCELLLW